MKVNMQSCQDTFASCLGATWELSFPTGCFTCPRDPKRTSYFRGDLEAHALPPEAIRSNILHEKVKQPLKGCDAISMPHGSEG